MEKEAAFPNDFPTDGVELRCFLMVSDYARSLAFYRDVLGATVIRELAGTLCLSPLCREPDSPVGPGWFHERHACRERSAASRPHERDQRYSAFGFLTARLPDAGPALSRSRVSHPALRVERRDPGLLP
jgi:catechol 2,3-dioxygenase-like lactoylglutathione lyase family enzyme